MDLFDILVALAIALFLKLFNVEITKLCKKIRNKPFETFVVLGLCIIIAFLYRGTFL